MSIDGLFDKYYFPYIFIEWTPSDGYCQMLQEKMVSLGYTPWKLNNEGNENDALIGQDDSCLFPRQSEKDHFVDIMWIHKTAKDIWEKKHERCVCEWQSSSLMMKTCRHNDTFSYAQPIKLIYSNVKKG